MSADITIKYRAIPNMNPNSPGWAPQIEVYSRSPEIAVGTRIGGWEHRGMDRESALQAAETRALEERDRYTGDWEIDVRYDRPDREVVMSQCEATQRKPRKALSTLAVSYKAVR